jgi:hypothetical protein
LRWRLIGSILELVVFATQRDDKYVVGDVR